MRRVFKRFKSGNKSAAAAAERQASELTIEEQVELDKAARSEADAAARAEAEAAAIAKAEAEARAAEEKAARDAETDAKNELIMSAVSKAAPPVPSGPRRPRMMIAGEFSAGKTHLINGLLGAKVLPSNVTATALPPIWLVPGRKGLMAVDLEGESRPLESLDEIGVEDTHYVVLSHPAPLLRKFEIIDTPGNSDPNIPSESWERMLEFADAVVWCSNATQAWRQSEKSVWNEMPARLLEKASIVITHADRMTDERSADRVLRRVKREASRYFNSFLMGSLLKEEDVSRIRDHLETLTGEMETRDGAPCVTVSGFAAEHMLTEADEKAYAEERAAAEKAAAEEKERKAEAKAAEKAAREAEKEAEKDAAKAEDVPADTPAEEAAEAMAEDKPAEIEATGDKPAEAEATEEKPAEAEASDDKPAEAEASDDKPAEAEAPEDKPAEAEASDDKPVEAEPAEDEPAIAKVEPVTPKRVGKSRGSKTAKARRAARARKSEEEGQKAASAEVHLFVPPASDAPSGDAADEGTARALWARLAKGLDQTDAKAVLACVDQLLEALDVGGETPNTPILDARENGDATNGQSHSAMSRRKS